MARSTYSPPITITNPNWSADEYVQARTIQTGGDSQWITSHSATSNLNTEDPTKSTINIDYIGEMQATIACMVTKWTLKKDQTDKFGNPIYEDPATGKVAQVQIPFPDDLEERLKIVSTLHALDIVDIYTAINKQAPEPMKPKEQEDFLPAVNVLTSTN